MWSITYWIISCLAVKKVQEGDTEGGWCKPLQWLSASWVEKYSCFFNHFQKVPKYLMCDELFHLGHLLSLPSSTFQRGYFFFSRVQNWRCQQRAATQLYDECHGWQLHSCQGIGWAFLVKQHHTGETCHWFSPWNSQMSSPWENMPASPYRVVQCLVVMTMAGSS